MVYREITLPSFYHPTTVLQLINQLTVKTLELGNALQYKKMVAQR
jgi:hypothetical protein